MNIPTLRITNEVPQLPPSQYKQLETEADKFYRQVVCRRDGNDYWSLANVIEFVVRFMEALSLEPIPMRLSCPECKELHIDEGEFATKPHHTHACQSCGNVWRPAIHNTVGVRFLPGFKNEGN